MAAEKLAGSASQSSLSATAYEQDQNLNDSRERNPRNLSKKKQRNTNSKLRSRNQSRNGKTEGQFKYKSINAAQQIIDHRPQSRQGTSPYLITSNKTQG